LLAKGEDGQDNGDDCGHGENANQGTQETTRAAFQVGFVDLALGFGLESGLPIRQAGCEKGVLVSG
jgi:hypothetical protein